VLALHHIFSLTPFPPPSFIWRWAGSFIFNRSFLFSQIVAVFDDGVRLLVKSEQNTIILRDIPSDTSIEDVRAIFSSSNGSCSTSSSTSSSSGAATSKSPGAAGKGNNEKGSDADACPAVVSVKPDMNDTWFVTFASEADARKALEFIRNRKFRGATVKARLKTESLNKAFFKTYGIFLFFSFIFLPITRLQF
jgi:hypothetical protein